MLRSEPFSDAHLDAAAELLAARHARHRATEPLLPEVADLRVEVEREWRADGASGVFVWRGSDAVAYLFGRPQTFGRFGSWLVVGIAGHAVEGDPEVARDAYAAAAAPWVEAGHARHAAFVPSGDAALVDAWFRLSFGAGAALALRETAPQEPFDAGVEIRPSTPDDAEEAARLDVVLTESMVPSPSFSQIEPEALETVTEEWGDTWDEDGPFVHFVAERDGRVVGHALLYRRPPDLRVPPGSIDLAQVATHPDVRGSGAGRALTAHVLRWAHDHGHAEMTTDWRMTNLWASRFWPRRGFRTAFLRLYRSIP